MQECRLSCVWMVLSARCSTTASAHPIGLHMQPFGAISEGREEALDSMLAMWMLLAWLPVASSHSYLALPPSRNLLANLAGAEDCPHCLQSGGPDNVKARAGGVWPPNTVPGSHGLCGDPVQGRSNPVRLQDETYLKAGPVQMTYGAGAVVEFQVAVSTHHQGHYEFRICDKPLDAESLSSAAEGQACLDKWLLQRAPPLADCVVNDPRGDCQPLDPKHPERWYLPPAGSQTQVAGPDFDDSMAPTYPSSGEVHTMRFKIPEGLQCSRRGVPDSKASIDISSVSGCAGVVSYFGFQVHSAVVLVLRQQLLLRW